MDEEENEEQVEREVAMRVSAAELSEIEIEHEKEHDMAPLYHELPTGGKVSRVAVAGITTDRSNLTEDDPQKDPYYQLLVNDKSMGGDQGLLVRAGSYSEAQSQVRDVDIPTPVMVIGKVRSYAEEDEDERDVYVQPEDVVEISMDEYLLWAMEMANDTFDRVEETGGSDEYEDTDERVGRIRQAVTELLKEIEQDIEE